MWKEPPLLLLLLSLGTPSDDPFLPQNSRCCRCSCSSVYLFKGKIHAYALNRIPVSRKRVELKREQKERDTRNAVLPLAWRKLLDHNRRVLQEDWAMTPEQPIYPMCAPPKTYVLVKRRKCHHPSGQSIYQSINQ